MQRLIGSDAGLQMPPTGAPDAIDVLRAWIDSGTDMPGRAAETAVVERKTEPRVQKFFDAIAVHDSDAVRKALASDRTLARASDGSGSTALMYSAYAGTVDSMEALLDAGAEVNGKNRRNATALHWAISDPAKVKLLLMKGADINAKSVDGRTATAVLSDLSTLDDRLREQSAPRRFQTYRAHGVRHDCTAAGGGRYLRDDALLGCSANPRNRAFVLRSAQSGAPF